MESQCKTHCLTPFREVWLTACRFVQRLTGEAVCLEYHISTHHASYSCKKFMTLFCILLYGAPVKFLIGFGYPTVYVKVVVCDKDPVTVAIMTVQFITRADPHYVITIDAGRGF